MIAETAPRIRSVHLDARSPERFREVLGELYREIERATERGRKLLRGRTIWHVNTTASGGGVAELLFALLPYVRGIGIDTRWVVVGDGSDFFAVTKRLHNRLHGALGDDGQLGAAESRLYERVLEEDGSLLAEHVRPGDIVYLHDPQTAGLVAPMQAAGAKVVWRCHVGVDEPNELAREAWRFLLPYLLSADALVFSRPQYVWEGMDPGKVWIRPPSIDPSSAKNCELDPQLVDEIVGAIGLGENRPSTPPVFSRMDGSPGRIEHGADVIQEAPLPAGAPLVAQVSRWDRLKDPLGLMRCFAEHLHHPDAHLLLAGPAVAAVSDDPEGAVVLEEVTSAWRDLPDPVRRRVHLVSLPMDNRQENATMVNALQRRADVVVQKSLAEGFGLTVLEAMWKGRPVVASGVGGIQDQIVDGVSGVLVADPGDLEGFATAIESLLADEARSARIGAAARERVIESFLGVRRLVEYLELVAAVAPRS
jgi:trehalose synthase